MSTHIRILQLVTKRQYRGAEVFAAELSALLGANGHEVVFAGLYHPAGNELTAANARNVDLNGQKSAFSFSLLKKLAALIRDFRPDIIQANGSDTLKYAVLARRLYFPDLQVVYRNISMVSSWASAGSMKNLFNRLLFKQVSFVTSVGQQSLEDLVKTYQYPVNQTRVIRRGIPEMSFSKNASRTMICSTFGFEESDPLLIHIGQFSDEKNHPFLLEAFSLLLKSHPKARFILIGEGKNRDHIAALIKDRNLDKHVFSAGHQSPVQEWLSAADIFVLGSTIEGVPGVILEAAMQSVPTVAVNVGGVGEVVRNHETGILLAHHDANQFARAVSGLLNDDQARINMGNEARRFTVEHYSLQGCLRNFEQLYAEVLASKKNR